ncbi:MAG TPA: NAD-binding protein [Methanomicrobiales archaeon]|jgi:Trk K+ transport system NAD-binding subunit|nr:NAD-binding protein [Methanomicrobiales archaeon]
MDDRFLPWRFIFSPGRRSIPLLIAIFTCAVLAYTAIFHTIYPLLEGKAISWPAALLFILETITTVGFGDLLPFRSDYTILFTIVLILTGVFMIFMFIPVLLEPVLSRIINVPPPTGTSREMKGHVVIAGYGPLARALVESLIISDLGIVVVEPDEAVAREVVARYRSRVSVVWGDYRISRTWEQAWVKHAHSVVVCEDERTAAEIILGIRDLTGGSIIAVVDDLSYDRFLRYAGAEYVLSPKNSTGKILARHAVIRPDVDTIFEAISLDHMKLGEEKAGDGSLKLVKVPVMRGCIAFGKSLGELGLYERYGVDLLFLWRAGEFLPSPGSEELLDASTMLFLLGKASAVSEVLDREFCIREAGEPSAVIAGFGDVGKAAYQELTAAGIRCTVIDPKSHGIPEVVGNAEEEAVLRAAGVERARFVIAAVNSDGVNIFTTLVARNLNPSVKILARASEPAAVEKLYKAGADYVALLPTIGGQVIAGIILEDIVRVLVDLPHGQKILMKHLARHAGTTVAELGRRSGVRIVGIEGSGRSVVRPGPGEVIRNGDSVIAVGANEDLRRLIRFI